MCYDCGERRRNFPFKLCEKCYTERRSRNAGHVVPGIAPAVASAFVHTSGVRSSSNNSGAVAVHDDIDDKDAAVNIISTLSIDSDSGKQVTYGDTFTNYFCLPNHHAPMKTWEFNKLGLSNPWQIH